MNTYAKVVQALPTSKLDYTKEVNLLDYTNSLLAGSEPHPDCGKEGGGTARNQLRTA